MAYLRELKRKCYRCKKAAVVALMSNRNEYIGDYCRKHGEQILKQQQEQEQVHG